MEGASGKNLVKGVGSPETPGEGRREGQGIRADLDRAVPPSSKPEAGGLGEGVKCLSGSALWNQTTAMWVGLGPGRSLLDDGLRVFWWQGLKTHRSAS